VTSLTLRLAQPAVSLRVPVRALLVMAVLALAVIAVAVLGLAMGRTGSLILPADLIDAVTGSGDPQRAFAVRELRLPRVLAAIVVGFGLGISGAIFQSLARNGLVSPDIVGVNSGASFAALVVIVLGTQARGQGDSLEVPYGLIAPAALLGAFAAAIAIYVMGYRKGLSPYRLVLVGIGVTAVLQAGIAYALTLTRFPFATELAFRWTIGSMYGVDWTEVFPGLLALGALLVVIVLVLRPLGALLLGDDTATGLGSRVERDRLLLLAIAVCFAALTVALAGPVGFVAFIAPHIAWALLRLHGPLLIIAAGLTGAILTALADFIGQRALAPVELPLGAVTALIGAPYFLVLLYRTNRIGAGG
jgi:iron complex transport system permease protein